VYSCETVVNTSTATSSANDKYDTYVRETKENETISRYSFYFTRYVNEIATSDRTEVAVFPTTGTVIVKFDQHAFDAVKSTSLDEKTILQKIDSFLKQSLTDSYVFVDYVLQMPRLIAIDGKCYLEYTVSLSLSSKDDPECIFTSLEILVVEL
jgi:hypothetical protein